YMHNEELCLYVAEQARAKVEQDFDIDVQVDKLATLFQHGLS
ncbi:glycosyltransferase family 4 protein, partial [bacterium]|nr:glycosyltransferase family 4 protein [bacterium]